MNDIKTSQTPPYIQNSNRWIKKFENMLKSESFEPKVFQGVIQSFINIKEKFGSKAEDYIEKELNKSDSVSNYFKKETKSMLGDMFEYKRIKKDILLNKDLLKKISKLSSSEGEIASRSLKPKTPVIAELKPSQKSGNIIIDIKRDVYASKGQVYEDVITEPTINNIDLIIKKKTKQIEYSDILTFEDFSKAFNKGARDSEIQEALSWFDTYIKSDDFSKDDIILNQKNEIDINKTILSMAEKINERSITPYFPFKFNRDSQTLYYNQATSGGVDVMLFIENSQKLVGASATKDRTFKIEGNQFIRHNYKMKATCILLESEIKKDENLKDKRSLTASDVRLIINKESFMDELSSKHHINRLGRRLSEDVYKNYTNRRKSEFTTHLTIMREYIRIKEGINLHKNGLNINSKEISIMDSINKYDGDYHFFGEVSTKFRFPEMMAGLNKKSYKENFQDVSSFKMDGNAINTFLSTLKNNYNNVENLEYADNYADRFLYTVIDSKQDASGLDSILSEGFAYKEEREVVFKSISTIINELNEIEDLSHSSVLSVFKENLKTLNSEELNSLTKSILSGDSSKEILLKVSSIKQSQSEVSNEFKELKNSLNTLSTKIELAQTKDLLKDIEKLGGVDNIKEQIEILKALREESNGIKKSTGLKL